MPIQIHPRFPSERDAYLDSGDALNAVYDGAIARTYLQAVDRETAISIARLAHHCSAREYLGALEVEDQDAPELPVCGGGVEGLILRIEGRSRPL